MGKRILPEPSDGSELARWESEGFRRGASNSNIVYFESPDEMYTLSVEADGPVHGYLIQLHAEDREDETPIGRTIIDDEELALKVAEQMAAAADDLDALAERPRQSPETSDREDVERDEDDTPEDWDEDEWQDALEDAYKKADVPRTKGVVTQKTIDGREYYYLQWREGDTVTSQYIAPVMPAE